MITKVFLPSKYALDDGFLFPFELAESEELL